MVLKNKLLIKMENEKEIQEDGLSNPECSPGYHWDAAAKKCVLDPVPPDPTHPAT